MSYLDEMKWRGLIQQVSDERLGEMMSGEKFTLYSGFDPTASSFHVGNLMPLLALRRAAEHGHTPVLLVGGATGMIGDPSGKADERKLLSAEVIETNLAGLRQQAARLVPGATIVNNGDWFRGLSYLDFLRDVGKHFTVNMMMGKESVRARLEDCESGISYTEFSYMLIQAYDFLHLHDANGCKLQIGGSEQWGNITAGIELIRRKRGKEAYALTLPLILDSSGKKFGKSEKGAVWLDPALTSCFDFYQYFFRVADADVGKMLRFLTLLARQTIEEIEEQVKTAPEKREGQDRLAYEVTKLVHGEEQARWAQRAAAAVYGRPESKEIEGEANVTFFSGPTYDVSTATIAAGYLLVDALAASGLCKSKSEAKREIVGGGIYVNGVRVQTIDHKLSPDDVQLGSIRLSRGKKNRLALKLI